MVTRTLSRLSVKGVTNKKRPGYYSDGGGLYLQVKSPGSRSWIFRYTRGLNPSRPGKPKQNEMGLGSTRAVSLAQARQKAEACRQQLAAGVGPKEVRDARQTQEALDEARTISFRQCAEKYIAAHRADWKNAKHIDQWTNTLETYCGPVFGELPVSAVDDALVLKVLEKIWTKRPETASRLRGRIESVLDWARVRGYRQGENPARWRGHLDQLLPKLEKRKRVKHHPALPFDQMSEFMVALHAQEGVAARALQFLILTATRTSEVVGARWSEFDMDAGVWTVPTERMKAGRAHRVPLSAQAMKLVRTMEKTRQSDFVFPGMREKTPLSNMAMLELLKRMKRDDITVHGFRSTFRDWAAERTNYAREVCEMALAHTVGDEVEAAYRRGDLFEKRRRLMAEWVKHCENTKGAGKVVSISRSKRSNAAA